MRPSAVVLEEEFDFGSAIGAWQPAGPFHPLSGEFEADAIAEGLEDGNIVGTRGISAGHRITLGPMALLRVAGMQVVVVSVRQQCKDRAMIEVFGIDIAKARSMIVRSRGYFRAAFDLLFSDDRIIEVDVPGLTTPILSRVPYGNVPRPIFPLEADTEWAPTAETTERAHRSAPFQSFS